MRGQQGGPDHVWGRPEPCRNQISRHPRRRSNFTAPAPATRYTQVEVAQEAWAKGIVDIGKVYQDKGDYKAKAEEVITELYGFKEEGMEVLFKPTKASEVPIRHDYDQAVSYFVGAAAAGDDIGIKEDKGFAINPWTVRCGVKTRIRASRCARRRCASRTARRY